MTRRYFLTCITCTALCLAAGAVQPQYALKGAEVALKPNIAGQPDSILWKHEGNKVVEFNGQEERVYGKYENRITLDWLSAKVTISDLRLEDSGEYVLEADINNRVQRSSYQLVVMEKVDIPSIKCEMTNGSSANISGVLLCTAELKRPQSLMKFEWRAHGNLQDGPRLQIPLGDEQDDEVYSCSVSNPLSSETATYTAKDCYPGESSSVTLVAILVPIVIVLLIVVAFLLYKFRSKVRACCCAKGDVEKASSPETKTGSQELEVRGEERHTLLQNEDSSHVVEGCDESVFTPQKGNTKLFVDMFEGRTPLKKDESRQTSPHGSSPHGGVTSPLARNNLPSNGQGCDENKEDWTPQKGSTKRLSQKFYTDCEKNKEGRTPLKKDEPLHGLVTSTPSRNNLPSNAQSDVDTDQHSEPEEEGNPSDSERGNDPHPAGVTDESREDTQSDLESPITPKQPGCDEIMVDWTPQKDEAQKTPHGSSPHGLVTSTPARNNLPSIVQGDVDTDQHSEPEEEGNPSDSERGNDPHPAGVTDESGEDTQSDLHLTSELPEPEKEADEDEEAQSASADPDSSAVALPHSPSAGSSPNMAPKDTPGEHKKDTDTDQGTAKKKIKESDLPEQRNESDDSIKNKSLSTEHEPNGSKTSLQQHVLNTSQEETNTSRHNQHETAKPVSEDESEINGVNEDTKEQDLYSSPVQQAQSPTPDYRNKPDQPNQTAGQ